MDRDDLKEHEEKSHWQSQTQTNKQQQSALHLDISNCYKTFVQSLLSSFKLLEALQGEEIEKNMRKAKLE